MNAILNEAYFVLMLPFTKGVVTTLLLFSGWLRTESGTVIRVGSFPCNDESTGILENLRILEYTPEWLERLVLKINCKKNWVKKEKKLLNKCVLKRLRTNDNSDT